MHSGTQEGYLGLFIMILLSTSVFSNYHGYSVSGITYGYELTAPTNLLEILDWVWETGAFLFNISTFQVDNIPVFVASIFIFIELMTIFIILKLIRGSS